VTGTAAACLLAEEAAPQKASPELSWPHARTAGPGAVRPARGDGQRAGGAHRAIPPATRAVGEGRQQAGAAGSILHGEGKGAASDKLAGLPVVTDGQVMSGCHLQEGFYEPSGNYIAYDQSEEKDAWLESLDGGQPGVTATLSCPCVFRAW
jgi:hypothetical protein